MFSGRDIDDGVSGPIVGSGTDRVGSHGLEAGEGARDRRGVQESARAFEFARANRHSSRVRVLKIALPMAAVVLLAGFVGYSMLSFPSVDIGVDLGKTGFADGKLVMSNPKVEGVSNNRPYSFTAERALQDMTGSQKIELEGIDAKLPIDAEQWATVDAERGIFDRQANTLSITSPVRISTTDGKRATLQSVFVKVDGGEMSTQDPVDITLDGVTISAGGMEALSGGKVLIFNSKVKMNIEPGKLTTAAADNGAGNVQN